MTKNTGIAAEYAFEAYWERRGHVERFPDKKDLTGLNQGKRLADFPKPADYLVSSPKDPLHYAEVKSTHHASRFEFKCIRPKQSATALKAAKRGDRSYFFYIFSYHLSRWFIMSCVQYAAICETGARSVPFDDLKEWSML